VRGELDLLVPPLGGAVVAGDQAHAVQAPGVALHERVAGLRLVVGADSYPVTGAANARSLQPTRPGTAEGARADEQADAGEDERGSDRRPLESRRDTPAKPSTASATVGIVHSTAPPHGDDAARLCSPVDRQLSS
jgi:hypothetical protein